ncbi:ABC transporter ATP-binding protein [Marilutibacter spongiae]|uniref:ABC transporter ATP-binding protein n=1 Tax=Marilutibacter spongiae TaxID=2025720 RepID=A0A7W3Y4I7_9GAMM|nr:ABC transporter ATP-binding protein [Lysobacter spongiae]MBB1059025.1 ABC transporter ATP-binding protein [Lysobacter spongiae]
MAHLKVENLGLDVPLYVHAERTTNSWLAALGGAALSSPKREFVTLLDGVSFEANEGDRIAIIGRNGAGKSTLLQLLTGAYQPTRGSIDVDGTRHALMNMSLGFNPEATVAENILLRGAAMGSPLAYAREMVRPVLEFAELGEKSNHRLRTLSSGQRMRLGFAISTSVQHDIMLLDEWIGTGDAEFIEKATTRMMDRVGGSKIVIMATHSLSLIRRTCNRAILIDRGQLKGRGSVDRVVRKYKDMMARHARHGT